MITSERARRSSSAMQRMTTADAPATDNGSCRSALRPRCHWTCRHADWTCPPRHWTPSWRPVVLSWPSSVLLVSVKLVCATGDKPTLVVSQRRYKPIGSKIDPHRTRTLPMCVRVEHRQRAAPSWSSQPRNRPCRLRIPGHESPATHERLDLWSRVDVPPRSIGGFPANPSGDAPASRRIIHDWRPRVASRGYSGHQPMRLCLTPRAALPFWGARSAHAVATTASARQHRRCATA